MALSKNCGNDGESRNLTTKDAKNTKSGAEVFLNRYAS